MATLVLTSDILESEKDGGEGECGREGACHDISTDRACDSDVTYFWIRKVF